jgi:hypothetical protein
MAIRKAKAFMKAFQGRSASVHTLPELHIPPPILNGVQIALEPGRPRHSPITERPEVGFNRGSNSIKLGMQGVVGRNQGWKERRLVIRRSSKEGFGLIIKGDQQGVNLRRMNSIHNSLVVLILRPGIIVLDLGGSNRGN